MCGVSEAECKECALTTCSWLLCCFKESVQRETEGAEPVQLHSRYRKLLCGVGFREWVESKIDLTIATRALTALHDHWWEEGHQSLEIRYRLQKGWTLSTRICTEASAAERLVWWRQWRDCQLQSGTHNCCENCWSDGSRDCCRDEHWERCGVSRLLIGCECVTLWTVSLVVGTFWVWVAGSRR